MAFISSAKHSSGKEDGNTACVPTASTNFPLLDINQIDEDDIEEMDIKWNMALLSMRADKFWKNAGKKISIQGLDMVGFDKSKKLEALKQEKERVDGKLAGLLTASKDLDNLIKSQRSDKNKEGLGYTDVPPPPAQLYLSPKKDLSWSGLPKCADDMVTDYSRPSPTVESTSEDDQNRNPSVSKNVASPITPKPFIKFVKPKDSQSESPDFVMKKKACFNFGDFNHLAYDCRKRVKKNFTPRPVSHKPYRPSQRPVRSNINDARPNRTFFNKQAHSYANRPDHRTSAVRSPYRAPWVPSVNKNYPLVNRKFSTSSRNFPTANRKFPTASRKFPTGSTKSSTADMGRKGKVGSSQIKIDDKGYWDSGCSWHMTGNISYLSDYELFDGGYVSFGQGG
nr:hypothetical protein [Tanacetum cinerariifolium]